MRSGPNMKENNHNSRSVPSAELEVQQSLTEHLAELRLRILRSLFFVLVAFIPLAIIADPLFTYLATPLMEHLPSGTQMIATEVVAPFVTPFKLAFYAAIFLAMPFILYQIWGFVAPGLYEDEQHLVRPLLVSSILLFYLGSAFAYFVVLPLIFRFLVATAPVGVSVMTDISNYLNFILKMFLAFGIAFETPVALVMLTLTGLVEPQQLRRNRPYILVGCFVVGMLLTPPDVFSQTLLALPTYLLFELGLWASSAVQRRRNRRGSSAHSRE